MDFNAIFSRILEIQPRNRLALITGTLGMIFFIVGLIWSFNPFSQPLSADSQAQDIKFIPANSSPCHPGLDPGSSTSGVDSGSEPGMTQGRASQNPCDPVTLVVDVSGAVLKPGVYELPADARLQDALIAAGGLASDADRVFISKSVNLAAKVVDGAKIYIPTKDEAGRSNVDGGSTVNTGVLGSSLNNNNLININSATSSQLDKLPGVGSVTAQKIIDARPYSSIDELKSKKVVGSKVYEQIKEKIGVN